MVIWRTNNGRWAPRYCRWSAAGRHGQLTTPPTGVHPFLRPHPAINARRRSRETSRGVIGGCRTAFSGCSVRCDVARPSRTLRSRTTCYKRFVRCRGRRVGPSAERDHSGLRRRYPDDRQHFCPGAPAGCDRKKGVEIPAPIAPGAALRLRFPAVIDQRLSGPAKYERRASARCSRRSAPA